jgi:hypothetical protein
VKKTRSRRNNPLASLREPAKEDTLMPLDTKKPLIAALLCIPALAGANTVHRCTDEAGNVTFTTHGCQAGQHLQLQEAHNPAPGSVAPPLRPTTEKPALKQTDNWVVIGQWDDGCGNVLSPEQRRKAMIDYQTPTGMTKRDVENLLGKPDKVVSRNGEVQYVYKEQKGHSRQVSFDEQGCVKSKTQKSKR